MNTITAWYSKNTGWTHTIAAVGTFLMLAYFNVPEFKAAVLQLYNAAPHWVEQVIVVGIALYGFYRNGEKPAANFQK